MAITEVVREVIDLRWYTIELDLRRDLENYRYEKINNYY